MNIHVHVSYYYNTGESNVVSQFTAAGFQSTRTLTKLYHANLYPSQLVPNTNSYPDQLVPTYLLPTRTQTMSYPIPTRTQLHYVHYKSYHVPMQAKKVKVDFINAYKIYAANAMANEQSLRNV